MSDCIKINARDCQIKDVSLEESSSFLEENHVQGKANSKVQYGLFYKNELIQLMTFSKPRFNKNYQWEIIRECTKKDYIVRGGTSKLWKHFLKNNRCHSCICYSYPHNNKHTNHYVEYCGFENIECYKPDSKQVFYVGEYKGKHREYSIAIVNRLGVDMLLGTRFGFDNGSNEEILFSLGFEKVVKDKPSPQIDVYYPFHVVYRVDDLTDGSFYIGMCEVEETWNSGYMGSGVVWRRHLEKHPNKSLHKNRRNEEAHLYKRTILKSDFRTPKDTRDYEVKEIEKYIKTVDGVKTKTDKKCLNTQTHPQSTNYIPPICNECGGRMGRHKKSCSEYEKLEKCPECGTAYGQHKRTCSLNLNKRIICEECGGLHGNHKSGCSHRKEAKPCPECGVVRGHKKTCSKAKHEEGCTCGAPIGGFHSKECALYKSPEEVCEFCGYKKRSNRHAKDCPLYKEVKTTFNICSECGAKRGHKVGCSHRKNLTPCSECGAERGHKKNCSKVKRCPECGGVSGRHDKSCSKYEIRGICSECGGKSGQHFQGCSKRIVCSECGGGGGKHKLGCSKYKAFK